MRKWYTDDRGSDQSAAWIDALYDRVGDGAWRLARRSLDDDAAAAELVVRAFREFLDSGGRDDVELLRCVLDHVKQHRSERLSGRPRAERRTSTDVRDAFELIYVGGARITDVAQLTGCSVGELSRRLIDSVRDPQLAQAR
ncbi:MAG: hypothetical protein JWL76_1080 [Thermoleophilia bacterium]|nr:hypothetical protein [Thermoleophilia bacterium]